MPLEKTSKLDAVNILLSAINQAPVNSLSQTTVDVTRALQFLDQASRDVQSEGWNFNTESEYALTPNNDGEIVLADSVLRVDLDPNTYSRGIYEVKLRGNRLYNSIGATFNFGTTQLVGDVVLGFDWEDLPQHARSYIAMKARRHFQDDSQGSAQATSIQSRDELEAYTRFKKLEGQQDDSNFLDSFQTAYGPRGF